MISNPKDFPKKSWKISLNSIFCKINCDPFLYIFYISSYEKVPYANPRIIYIIDATIAIGLYYKESMSIIQISKIYA